MLAGRSRCPSLAIVPETFPQKNYQLLTELCFVSDFVFRINPKPHDQPHHLWRMEPAQAVALLTDRQVVLQTGLATKLVRYNVISLPSLTNASAANVTCSIRLLEDCRAFHRC